MNGTESGAKDKIGTYITISSIIAMLTGFSYVFGSLYARKYYEFFGIPNGAISFTVQEYVSYSLLPLIFALQIGIWIELLHYNIVNNYFWGFSLTRIGEIRKVAETKERLSFVKLARLIYADNPSDACKNVAFTIMSLFTAVFLLISLISNYWNNIPISGVYSASILAFGVGTVTFFGNQLLKLLYSQNYSNFGLAQLIASVAVLSTFYIFSVGMIAESQARYDIPRFSTVVIVAKTDLPTEIAQSSETQKQSKYLRIIMINGNRLYVFTEEDFIKQKSGKKLPVYALNYSSIDYIQYLGAKQ
ncbi:MAG: hypothetical protein HW384_1007 [Dehalococcoidia bacterium]|nr:hypothetical protein [Dehalococcoidia bacterium]